MSALLHDDAAQAQEPRSARAYVPLGLWMTAALGGVGLSVLALKVVDSELLNAFAIVFAGTLFAVAGTLIARDQFEAVNAILWLLSSSRQGVPFGRKVFPFSRDLIRITGAGGALMGVAFLVVGVVLAAQA